MKPRYVCKRCKFDNNNSAHCYYCGSHDIDVLEPVVETPPAQSCGLTHCPQLCSRRTGCPVVK